MRREKTFARGARGRSPCIVDLKAPVFGATQAVADHSLYQARAKRITISALQDEWQRLVAHLAKIDRRILSRDRTTPAQADLKRRYEARMQEIAAKLEEMGALTIHSPVSAADKAKQPWAYRAKDVRKHPERKASPVRRITPKLGR